MKNEYSMLVIGTALMFWRSASGLCLEGQPALLHLHFGPSRAEIKYDY